MTRHEEKGVVFTQDKARQFAVMYRLAVKAGLESFEFEGHEYLTSYARYLVEYLEMNYGSLA